jgi:dTDP-glucose 4,6-dehydratase
MNKVLVTGGAGFIGSNFIRSMFEMFKSVEIINYDLLTYAANLENLTDVRDFQGYRFVRGDICDRDRVYACFQEHNIDTVVHFAAESHVDRSILGPEVFVRTNVLGTEVLLEAGRQFGVEKFIHVSTDEVYGSLGDSGKFQESTPLHPNSPYSSSKAGSDLLALAYHHTYGLPVVVTRCSNNYGPYQFPEKLIPLMIINVLEGKRLPVYGDGRNIRDWIHVRDHCSAIIALLLEGEPGEVYNIGANTEWMNIDIVRFILRHLGKSEDCITYVQDRPGHDRRYAMDTAKINRTVRWLPKFDFETGLRDTIDWYVRNKHWWSEILTGEYHDYYRKQYQEK